MIWKSSTPLEWEEQASLVKWLGLHPVFKDYFCKNDNEGKRAKTYTPSEKKTPTWILQENFLESVKHVGFQGHFCYGCWDAIDKVEDYLKTC